MMMAVLELHKLDEDVPVGLVLVAVKGQAICSSVVALLRDACCLWTVPRARDLVNGEQLQKRVDDLIDEMRTSVRQ